MKKEKSDFLEYALKSGRIRPLEDAFDEFPVEEEYHKGNAYYYVKEENGKYNKYSVGDIIYSIHEDEILFKVGKVNIEQIIQYRENFKEYKES